MLATDAPFGVSDDPQERSKRNSTILIFLLYTGRGARQLRRILVAAQVDMGRSTGPSIGVARGASRLGVFEEENFSVRSIAPRLSRAFSRRPSKEGRTEPPCRD